MSKQHLFLPILIYFSCNAVTTAQIIGGSIVDVPNLGAIRGKEIKTVGNLNYNQKTYHTFRNIPYAESVSGSKRFSVKSISLEICKIGLCLMISQIYFSATSSV